jgi:hypothetical protein
MKFRRTDEAGRAGRTSNGIEEKRAVEWISQSFQKVKISTIMVKCTPIPGQISPEDQRLHFWVTCTPNNLPNLSLTTPSSMSGQMHPDRWSNSILSDSQIISTLNFFRIAILHSQKLSH